MSLAPLLASGRMDWQTPDLVLDLVRQVAPIGLDPCTTRDNPCGAARWFYPPEHDGLSLTWTHYGLVYCNPPYGRAIGRWTAKARTEAEAGAEVVLLVPARKDTRWWKDAVQNASGVAFWRGRITFRGAPSPAPFPSALLYYGTQSLRFLDAMATWCWVVTP